MRCRLLACLVLAPLLMAQTADIQRLRAPADDDGLLGTSSPRTLQPGRLRLGLLTHYENKPLTWRYPDGTYEPVIEHKWTLEVGATYGVWDRIDVGVSAPFALVQVGEAQGAFPGSGAGDLRLMGRIQILRLDEFPIELVLLNEFTFATGDDSRFLGDPGFGWFPQAITALTLGPFEVLGSLGYRVRSNAEVADIELADELHFRVGAILSTWFGRFPSDLLAEVGGTTNIASPFANAGELALEGLVGARSYLSASWRGTVGVGAGMSLGVGIPTMRLIVGLGYVPRSDDRDGDGLPDQFDQCPDDPEDRDDFEDFDGCPEDDNDRDGVPDDVDQCPDVAEDLNNVQDYNGCPPVTQGYRDSDSDGIADEDDVCPFNAEDDDDFEDEDGCPEVDNDQDGVFDSEDMCPDEEETINGIDDEDGCPDEGEGDTEVVPDKIELKGTVLFHSGSSTIRDESFQLLNQVALQILAHPAIELVRIEGHTDSLGASEDNFYLSQDRADSVRRYLIKRGVEGERLEAKGFGEDQPIDTNTTAEGRQRNRRVDFVIVE